MSSSNTTTKMMMSSSSMFLHGKRALITGGGGTIGRAIAKTLLQHGATVVLAGRRIEKLEEAKIGLLKVVTAESPRTKLDSKIHVVRCDISQEDAVVHLFEQIDRFHKEEKEHQEQQHQLSSSSIDLLINNAGCNIAGPTEDLTANDMDYVLSVNVTGAFLCAREAIKRMKNNGGNVGGGRIINIGSISATSPRPNSVTYTTSKFALQGLTKSLALDGRPHNIAVGIIHPGNVVSDLLSEEDVKIRGELEGFIQADDVARCVATMASLPYSANVLELTVIPTTQPLVGRG
jgi:NAD(P)-dependent dehydrogenase (short-subunit alcohol dehydrogenase family)